MITEDAVEAAAKALYCAAPWPTEWHGADGARKETYLHYARIALEAAAPRISAAALRDAADVFENLPVNKGPEISSGTWDWFELFPIAHLRERAERMTQRPD